MSDEYDRCPECGSGAVQQWCMGWFNWDPDDPHDHDPNRRQCYHCKETWWVACPVEGCDWATERKASAEAA